MPVAKSNPPAVTRVPLKPSYTFPLNVEGLGLSQGEKPVCLIKINNCPLTKQQQQSSSHLSTKAIGAWDGTQGKPSKDREKYLNHGLPGFPPSLPPPSTKTEGATWAPKWVAFNEVI